MKLPLALALASLAAACQYNPVPIKRVGNYVEAESDASRQAGTASIEGEAFARQKTGVVITGAGREVRCLPVNPYTREVFDAAHKGRQVWPTDERMYKVTRSTRADAQGHFRFDGLPAGRWLVRCTISWENNVDEQFNVRDDVYYAAEVKTRDGETVEALVTQVGDARTYVKIPRPAMAR